MVSERLMTECILTIVWGEGTPQLNLHYSVGQQSPHNMVAHWLSLAFLLCDWVIPELKTTQVPMLTIKAIKTKSLQLLHLWYTSLNSNSGISSKLY